MRQILPGQWLIARATATATSDTERCWQSRLIGLATVVVMAMSCAAIAAHATTATGQRCQRHAEGTVDCQQTEKGTYEYSWPVTPDMVGQTVDASSLSLGVTIFPPVQRIASGQSRVTFEIKGAKPGQVVRLVKKLLQANPQPVDSSDMCCIESYEVRIPETPVACKRSTAMTPPARPPINQSRPLKRPQIEINKQCPACPAGGKCQCIVTVRNVGTELPREPIRIMDETRIIGSDDGRIIKISNVSADGDDWHCSEPGTSLECELPAASLRPVSARSVIVTYQPLPLYGRQTTRVHNCARLQTYAQSVSISGNSEACVDFGSDIAVQKSGGKNCRVGESCNFDIKIENRGQAKFTGKLMLADELSLGASAARAAEIVSIDPPLGCDSSPKALPFSCVSDVALAAGEARVHHISVRLSQQPDDASNSEETLKGRNCFAAIGQQSDDTDSLEAVQSLLQNVRNTVPSKSVPTQSSGSCVEFAALPRCPGDLVQQGTQCACPGNQERFDDDKCRTPCSAGEYRDGNRCVANGPAPPPSICPDGYTGTYPDCKPIQSVAAPPSECPDGYSGTYPDCAPAVAPYKSTVEKETTGGSDGSYDPPKEHYTHKKPANGGGGTVLNQQQYQVGPSILFNNNIHLNIPHWKKHKPQYTAPPPYQPQVKSGQTPSTPLQGGVSKVYPSGRTPCPPIKSTCN